MLRIFIDNGEIIGRRAVSIATVVALPMLVGIVACTGDRNHPSAREDDSIYAMPTLEPGTPRQAGASILLFPEFPIPWTMVAADVIVRAKLMDVRPAVEQNKTEPPYFAAAKDLVFEPIEFLKGSGPDQLRVRVAYIHPQGGSEERALAVAEYLVATHPESGRFVDREAILLLNKYMSNSEVGKNLIAGRPRRDRSEVASHDPSLFAFAHSHTWGYNPSIYEYEVTSKSNKAWLPAAGGDGEDTMYFTDHETEIPNAFNGSEFIGDDPPTVTLREMRSRIAHMQEDVNDGDGSSDHLRCVAAKHSQEYGFGYSPEHQHGYRTNSVTMRSGLPAESIVHSVGYSPGSDVPDKIWTTGDASKYLEVRLIDDVAGYRPDKKAVYATRPLPQGEYTFFFNTQYWEWIACDYYPDSVHETYEWTVAVEAPEGTLHEAFFDPDIDGDSVGFVNDEFGTLTPANIADSAISIDRFSWSGDQVELSGSGIGGLSETVADFIDLRGETFLTLSLGGLQGDEECGADSSSLVWSVAEQPWRQDDQLMIRIRDSSTETTALPVISCG